MVRQGISVVMPAFNEGLGLAPVLERLHASLEDVRLRHDVELIVVDDGSTDATPGILRDFEQRHPGALRTGTHAVNKGLVEALKTGARMAREDTLVMLDGDLSYAPEIVEPLAGTLASSRAGVVLASPYMKGGRVGHVPPLRLAASRVANWLLSLCVGGRIKTFTGMVRAYDANLFRDAAEREPVGEFNAWMIGEILRRGRDVVEIPATLDWPAARILAPSRMTLDDLISRAKLVVTTARALRGAGHLAETIPSHGTEPLVL